jgi:multicomponent Na+:H+ antiporter subunit E
VSDVTHRDALRHAGAFAGRAVLFAVLWWILAEGEVRTPGVAGVLILVTAGLSFARLGRGAFSFRPGPLPGFALYFVKQSVLGGIDVARRALQPSMPLEPDFIEIQLPSTSREARALAVNIVSLLPGTLAARLDDDRLLVHALDARQQIAARLGELQRMVHRVIR